MILRIAVVSGLILVAVPASALAFGPPVAISVGRGHQAANGPSGGATISGDNRKARLVAFHSEASNLLTGDSNRVSDVFVYKRPGGFRPGGGSLRRVSLANGGGQANGPSLNPALDGRVLLGDGNRRPHCVAFESKASNLTGSDHNKTSDVFVRDLRRGRTILVSRGISAAATHPAIDGSCKTVGFQAGSRVYLAKVGGGVRSVGRGHDIDLALDGKGVTWVAGGKVKLRRAGHTSTVAPGSNPTVSDLTSTNSGRVWGVSFETSAKLTGRDHNRGSDVYLRTLRASGGVRKTDLISAYARGERSIGGDNENGGLTAFAAADGFIWFVNHERSGSTLFYRNNRSGNIDDLFHADNEPDDDQEVPYSMPKPKPGRAITGVVTSARGNFAAFTSSGRGTRSVYLISLGGK
jgi:hypothetical protein